MLLYHNFPGEGAAVVQELVKEYRESLRIVRRLKEKTDRESDRQLLTGMERDLMFAIEWMQTGRRPGSRRGAERLASYQREKPVDPIIIQNYVARSSGGTYCTVTESDRERIEDALSCLTRLEREVYIMAKGQCLPRSEIALLIGVEKGTVNKILARAEKKIEYRIQTSLFCLPIATI